MTDVCQHLGMKIYFSLNVQESNTIYHRKILTAAQEACGALAQMAKEFGWGLWYARPKIHMMQHVVFPGCILT